MMTEVLDQLSSNTDCANSSNADRTANTNNATCNPVAPRQTPLDDSPVSVTSGQTQIRLATTEKEVHEAQNLRWRVFYEEMKAKPTPEMEKEKRDFDRYDSICDHLLVFDEGRIVGTYRMLRRSIAAVNGGHYTAGEFNIKPLLEYPGEILEVGRSCVDPAYRTRNTMQLLWQGIAAYVSHHDISLLFGCASMHGTDPNALALPLSYLHYHHLAPPALRVRALPERYVDMRRMEQSQVSPRLGFCSLPPLLKGYLRLGGFIGEGAVVDPEFNTTDVCILVRRETITDRYIKHYERKNNPDTPEDNTTSEPPHGDMSQC